MTKEYLEELEKIINIDFAHVAAYLQQSHGLPLEISLERFAKLTTYAAMLMCIDFREKHPKIFPENSNPYLILNRKHFGVLFSISKEEFCEGKGFPIAL